MEALFAPHFLAHPRRAAIDHPSLPPSVEDWLRVTAGEGGASPPLDRCISLVLWDKWGDQPLTTGVNSPTYDSWDEPNDEAPVTLW